MQQEPFVRKYWGGSLLSILSHPQLHLKCYAYEGYASKGEFALPVKPTTYLPKPAPLECCQAQAFRFVRTSLFDVMIYRLTIEIGSNFCTICARHNICGGFVRRFWLCRKYFKTNLEISKCAIARLSTEDDHRFQKGFVFRRIAFFHFKSVPLHLIHSA